MAAAVGGVSFGEPVALIALLLVPAFAAVVLVAMRRRRLADAAYGGAAALRQGRSATLGAVRVTLLLSAVVLLVLALARPRWGESEAPVERRGIDIAIALDVSRSMTANDVETTRAERAVASLDELLVHLRGDRVGLVIFGGTAFERSPLTTDHAAIAQLIARAQGESALVRPGSEPGVAIETALALLAVDDAAEAAAIVLVSDGESTGQRLDSALQRARDRGVAVHTVIAGTADGGTLTDQYARGESSQADPDLLAGIATRTGGVARDLDSLPGLAVDFRNLRQTVFEENREHLATERFQWPLAGALVLLLAQALVPAAARFRRLSQRRVLPATLAAVGLFAIGCAGSAAYRAMEDGNEAYEAGRYDEALAHYREAESEQAGDPVILYNVGNALHRLGRFEEAAVVTEGALAATEDAEIAALLHYSAGAHAFERGSMREARSAYVEALRRRPDDEDSKANLELVLDALEPTPAPTPEDSDSDAQDGDEDSETDGDENGTPGGDQSDSQGAGEGSEGSDDSQPGEPGDGAPGGAQDDGPASPSPRSLEEAQAQLAEAIAMLGEDITPEDAARILELARQANALERLPPRNDTLAPPR